jgi:hypothetical protein
MSFLRGVRIKRKMMMLMKRDNKNCTMYFYLFFKKDESEGEQVNIERSTSVVKKCLQNVQHIPKCPFPDDHQNLLGSLNCPVCYPYGDPMSLP